MRARCHEDVECAPPYTTVMTLLGRMENKGAARRRASAEWRRPSWLFYAKIVLLAIYAFVVAVLALRAIRDWRRHAACVRALSLAPAGTLSIVARCAGDRCIEYSEGRRSCERAGGARPQGQPSRASGQR